MFAAEPKWLCVQLLGSLHELLKRQPLHWQGRQHEPAFLRVLMGQRAEVVVLDTAGVIRLRGSGALVALAPLLADGMTEVLEWRGRRPETFFLLSIPDPPPPSWQGGSTNAWKREVSRPPGSCP